MDNIDTIQESWFSTPIWATILKHDNQELEKYCNSLIQQNKKATMEGSARDGGWQSEKIYHKENIENQSYKDLFDKIYVVCKGILNIANLNERYNIAITDSWFNKSYSNSWFERHCHSGSILSGVYYVKAPEKCGKIIFYNPCDISTWWNQTYFNKNKYFYSSINYSPIEGELILFPSWLTHSVEKNESDSDRISIAFNVTTIDYASINFYLNDNIQKN